MKEGTPAVLSRSGLDEKWWAESMEWHCCLRNLQNLSSDGNTLFERRFGIPFYGRIIPFGSKIEYHPISAKDLSRPHRFGPKVLPVMLCMREESGKETLWSQTLNEELEEMDASELQARRLNAKEVLTPMK